MTRKLWLAAAVLAAAMVARSASAGYAEVKHEELKPGCIEVTGPGNCDQPGKTYMLTKDVTADGTALFLAKDVTLDLNGYTLTYCGAKYEHVPNWGFEEGLAGWDVSKAPGAEVLDTDKVKPFIGKKICSLKAGSEIVSKHITLPVADRSYYAMCGVLTNKMSVTVSVEDEKGSPVQCEFRFAQNVRPSCPQTASPKLGGGFVFAHLHHKPAGKYRIRVKAETDCLIDEVDIRPALDAGVAVIEKTLPWAYYKCIIDGDGCAFFDFTKPGTTDQPVDSVPHVSGAGTVTIRNGVIKSGFEGVRSWGVQSTAGGVKVVFDNVKIAASGINTNALDVAKAEIKNCRFDINTPFIIDRHRLSDSACALTSADGSEVSGSEFYGGQGCLMVGAKSDVKIHDNLFVNRQTVTNHYSIMLGGAENVRIYNNRFEPETGSGITIFGSKNNEVFGNTFRITAANGNCEYTNEDYSTNAIRMTDYGAAEGSPKGVWGNKIHNNKFFITGKHYTNYRGLMTVATAIFCSVGAGKNEVYDNDVVVDHKDPGTPAVACAFYIGGAPNGGEYYNNRITTNVPAFWIATFYGPASKVSIHDNTITKAPNAGADFKPYRFGHSRHAATNIAFKNNKYVGCAFGIDATNAAHSYTGE